MGYIVRIDSDINPRVCLVMQPSRKWMGCHRDHIFDPDKPKVWVFAMKETAEREAARVRASDRRGPDPQPEGEVQVVRVDDGFPDPTEKWNELIFDFGIVQAKRPKDSHKWEVYLPHSCDEWVIGNLDEVQVMIDQLEKAKQLIQEDLASVPENTRS